MIKQKENTQKIKVGITHGDFNGISYEIIIKTLQDNRLLDLFTPVVYGSSKIKPKFSGQNFKGQIK